MHGIGSPPSGFVSGSANSGVIRNYRFVKLAAQGQLAECDAGERCIGCITDGSKLPPMDSNESTTNVTEAAGQSVPGFIPPSMVGLVLVGSGGVTVGHYVVSDTDGQAVEATSGSGGSGEEFCGIALRTASAGELCDILIWPNKA